LLKTACEARAEPTAAMPGSVRGKNSDALKTGGVEHWRAIQPGPESVIAGLAQSRTKGVAG